MCNVFIMCNDEVCIPECIFDARKEADISSHSCPEERRHLLVVNDVSCHRHRYSSRVSLAAVGVCWQAGGFLPPPTSRRLGRSRSERRSPRAPHGFPGNGLLLNRFIGEQYPPPQSVAPLQCTLAVGAFVPVYVCSQAVRFSASFLRN